MTPESPSPVITIRENKIMRTPLMDAVKATQEVTEHIKNKDFDGAMTLRDSEFKEYHYAYLNTATPDHPKLILPQEKVDMEPQTSVDFVLMLCRECELRLFMLVLRQEA
jgi:6-phosphofructokinase 1